MKQTVIIGILSCVLLFAAACGYRTAPVPYAKPDERLPVLSEVSLRQQGNNWVFHWAVPGGMFMAGSHPRIQEPEADATSDTTSDTPPDESSIISRFQLNIYRGNSECPTCDNPAVMTLILNPVNGEVRSHADDGLDLPLEAVRFSTDNGRQFSLRIPAVLLRKDKLADKTFYTIAYTLQSGVISAPSTRLDTLNLKPVPIPQIKLYKRIENTELQNESPETFLLLDWKPQQETIRHTLQKDGRIAETVVFYGLNLYRSDLESGVETLITPSPLRSGRFSLLNFQGRLTARQVDRYGNESESITVFEAQYRLHDEKNNAEKDN